MLRWFYCALEEEEYVLFIAPFKSLYIVLYTIHLDNHIYIQ